MERTALFILKPDHLTWPEAYRTNRVAMTTVITPTEAEPGLTFQDVVSKFENDAKTAVYLEEPL